MSFSGSRGNTSGLSGTGSAQTTPIALLLIFALVIVGTIGIVTFGGNAVSDTQDRSEVERANHAMTQFDSQASLVGLGRSSSQTVRFANSRGNFEVDPTQGHITVEHIDWDGSSDEVIVNQAPLGAAIYTLQTSEGPTEIAYQGGGVWRRGPNGEARMVSSPEFHYRSGTLTLPIIQITNEDSAAGSVRATVSRPSPTTVVFPDKNACYGGSCPPAYINPADDGKVKITVVSEYADAWENYFRQRTDASINRPGSNEVQATLKSTGTTGHFQMPGDEGSIFLRGITDHSVTDYSITLRPDDTDSANFNNLQWSMYADEGDQQFELHLRKGSGTGGQLDCGEAVKATVYYSPADGDADDDDPYHGWMVDPAYTASCADLNGDGDDEIFLEADFVDDEDGNDGAHDDEGSADPSLEYQSLASSDVHHFDPSGDPLIDDSSNPELAGHSFSPNWEPREYDAGEFETVDRLINHYFSELDGGDGFDLTVDDKSSNTVTESKSGGEIHYSPGNQFITYMHITKNEIDIRLG